jgi:hypothetical protein
LRVHSGLRVCRGLVAATILSLEPFHAPLGGGQVREIRRSGSIVKPRQVGGGWDRCVRLQCVPVFSGAARCLQYARRPEPCDEPSPRSVAPARVLSGEQVAAGRPAARAAARAGPRRRTGLPAMGEAQARPD